MKETMSRTEAVLLDFDHTLAHLGSFIRWEDARSALLPLYREAGVPEEFLQAHEGALGLYRDVAAADALPGAHRARWPRSRWRPPRARRS
jgi:hypothetical protein